MTTINKKQETTINLNLYKYRLVLVTTRWSTIKQTNTMIFKFNIISDFCKPKTIPISNQNCFSLLLYDKLHIHLLNVYLK